MKESKYYYNGIPLSVYCKENGINISTVRARIWKKRRNHKYDKYTDQEIIDMVINAYGTSIKYFYKNISLRKYCLENNLNFKTIYERVISLKKKYPELSNDKLCAIAIEDFHNNNYRFYYNGVSLIEYCRKHPEINYNTIRSYINRELSKNPDLSINEIIENYINKENKGIYKYYYLGIPLKKYCINNNLNYDNIVGFISRCKEKDEYKNLSNNDLIEKVMDNYEPFKLKYTYQGYSLFDYCKKNNFSYYSVISYVKRKIKLGSDKSIDELIIDAINTINRYGVIYYYDGMPLVEYASIHNLNVNSIRLSIIRKKLNTDKELQDIVDDAVKDYVKYFYDGIPLSSYLSRIDLNYQMVIAYYNRYYKDKNGLSFDEAITEIIKKFKDKPPVKDKYFYKGMYLSDYCKKMNYNYDNIIARLKLLSKKNPTISNDELVKKVLDKYIQKQKFNQKNQLFSTLDNKEPFKERSKKGICNKLNISYNNMLDLVEMGFSFEQGVKIIWFFSDKKNQKGRKIITDIRLEEIYRYINYISNLAKKDEIKSLELYYLNALYKCGLFDTRELILKREESYLTKVVIDYCAMYGISVRYDNFDDFYIEAQIILLSALEKNNDNEVGRFIKFVDITVKGYFRQFLKKYKEINYISDSKRTVHFDQNINGSSKRTYSEVYSIENQSQDINEFLSDQMKGILNLLSSKEDKKYIYLRFCENYSQEELSRFFNISLDEVFAWEEKILSFLRIRGVQRGKKEEEDVI